MSTQIKEIMDWFDQFNNNTINVTTQTAKEIEIEIKNSALPHLLGLQYTTNNKRLKGLKLYYSCYGKNDDEIFKLISRNNPNKLQSVKNRINTFQSFMENLENAYLVENTHPKSKIRSKQLLIETKQGLYFHLGLLSTNSGQVLSSFEMMNKKQLETYLVDRNNQYYKNSRIHEKVIKIEKYVGNKLVQFSFDEKKQRQYGLEASQQVINEKPSIKDKITTYQLNISKEDIAKARDKPEQNKDENNELEL